MFTLIAEYYYGTLTNGVRVPRDCELGFEGEECIYVDPNPLNRVNDQGHNHFLSKNGIEIESRALFGELYFKPSEDVKITLGARYTKDNKDSSQIPSQLLLGGGTDTDFAGLNTGGRVNSGYPKLPNIVQSWSEFTGRAVIDWKPDLGFTDDTLVYASVSRGYKGGGTNPPRVDINPNIVTYLPLEQTFRPEFVNAFEIGMKNSFAGGRASINIGAFYYDYKDYQISQIVDRIAYNENFDATSWGVELEAVFRPVPRLRIDSSLGYLRTKIAKGETSIDVMNRTQGDPDWVVLRPWLQAPSNCVAPRRLVEEILRGTSTFHYFALAGMCPGGTRIGDYRPDTAGCINFDGQYGFTYDPVAPYDPSTVGAIVPYDPANPTSWIGGTSWAPNGGRGFSADLAGNELPNSPRVTFNIGVDYRIPVDLGRWELGFRGDYYRQSKSYSRVYNTQYDRIRGWNNVNISVTLSALEHNLALQAYVNNHFNKDSITDAFTNADDTGLSTNVFLVDPRIMAFSISKKF